MRRVLSAVVAAVVLLGLGVLAILALPGGRVNVAPVSASALVQLDAAPDAATKVNVVAMPLDAAAQFAAAGKGFDADGLATAVGGGVTQVLTWNAATDSYRTWYPQMDEGDNFLLSVGGVYRLVLDGEAPGVLSLVGDVPEQGSIHFALTRPTGSGCVVNDISLPLDRADITDARMLADAIGNVQQVLEWNASTQSYRTYWPADDEGDNFMLRIGYPYRLCLAAGGAVSWP